MVNMALHVDMLTPPQHVSEAFLEPWDALHPHILLLLTAPCQQLLDLMDKKQLISKKDFLEKKSLSCFPKKNMQFFVSK